MQRTTSGGIETMDKHLCLESSGENDMNERIQSSEPGVVAPIMELEQNLMEIFNDPQHTPQERTEDIRALMSEYMVTQKDWQNYCYFSDLHYTRNLVTTNPKFELILLCWKAGQASRIHNHSGSNCWMGVVQGPMIESLYTKVSDGKVLCEAEHPSQPGVCPELRLEAVNTYHYGDVGYIHDGIGLHRVQAGLAGGVTLHLYSPPISVATLFEPDNNAVVRRTPGFFSIGGKRLS